MASRPGAECCLCSWARAGPFQGAGENTRRLWPRVTFRPARLGVCSQPGGLATSQELWALGVLCQPSGERPGDTSHPLLTGAFALSQMPGGGGQGLTGWWHHQEWRKPCRGVHCWQCFTFARELAVGRLSHLSQISVSLGGGLLPAVRLIPKCHPSSRALPAERTQGALKVHAGRGARRLGQLWAAAQLSEKGHWQVSPCSRLFLFVTQVQA